MKDTVKTIIRCKRCNGELKVYGWKPEEEAAKLGWLLDSRHDVVLCPHCMGDFRKFMRGEPTCEVVSVTEDSVSSNICPMCYGEMVVLKGNKLITCPECKGSGIKKGDTISETIKACSDLTSEISELLEAKDES